MEKVPGSGKRPWKLKPGTTDLLSPATLTVIGASVAFRMSRPNAKSHDPRSSVVKITAMS